MADARKPGPLGVKPTPAPAPGVFQPSPPPARAAALPGPVGTQGPSANPAASGSLPSPTTGPKLVFDSPAADAVFLIDTTPKMPQIDVEVRIDGVTPNPTASQSFSWTVKVEFDEANVCSFGKQGVVFSDSLTATATGGKFSPSFPWMRGGRLTLTAEATVNGIALKESLLLWIFGTDPGWAAVKGELGNDTLRKIVRGVESGGIQFENDSGKGHNGVPLLNKSNRDGGGGICQITPPTAEDLWNWKTNIASGKRVFQQKQAVARGYPATVAHSPAFTKLVQDLNTQRRAQGLPTLTVNVPPFTAAQVDRDAIRGYRGYFGTDSVSGLELHEFRLSVVNGFLQVANVNEQASTADAVWVAVPNSDHPVSPDYVDKVLATTI